MKAIQLSVTGSPDQLRLVELPDPVPAQGQALIQVRAAAVNFMDLLRVKGLPFDIPTPLPFTPGAEVAGTVVALGRGVENVKIGDRVFGLAGLVADGGWAQLAIADAQGLMPVPEKVSFEQATGLSVVGAGAAILLIAAAGLQAGETVFIPAAAGGFGSFAVQIAKALGAVVIAGAGTPEKRKIAQELGADHTVDYRAADWAEQVRRLTGGHGVDVVLEAMGPGHVAESLSILAPFGRLYAYGTITATIAGSDQPVDSEAMARVLFNPAPGQAAVGFNAVTWLTLRPQQSFAAVGRLLAWLADGTVTGPRVTSLPLAEAGAALGLLERGENIGKVVLVP
jgi:NADPH2:quinone reductase